MTARCVHSVLDSFTLHFYYHFHSTWEQSNGSELVFNFKLVFNGSKATDFAGTVQTGSITRLVNAS